MGIKPIWDNLLPTPGQQDYSGAGLQQMMLDLQMRIPGGEAAGYCDVTKWGTAGHVSAQVQDLANICLNPDITQRPTPAQVLGHEAFLNLPEVLPADSPLRTVRSRVPFLKSLVCRLMQAPTQQVTVPYPWWPPDLA